MSGNFLAKGPIDEELKKKIENKLRSIGYTPLLTPHTVEKLTRKCMTIPKKDLCVENAPKILDTQSESLINFYKETDKDKIKKINKSTEKMNKISENPMPTFPEYTFEYKYAGPLSLALIIIAGLMFILFITFAIGGNLKTKDSQPKWPEIYNNRKKAIGWTFFLTCLFLGGFFACYWPVLRYYDELSKFELAKEGI